MKTETERGIERLGEHELVARYHELVARQIAAYRTFAIDVADALTWVFEPNGRKRGSGVVARQVLQGIKDDLRRLRLQVEFPEPEGTAERAEEPDTGGRSA